jgi:ketosteroid isomerase-like protein
MAAPSARWFGELADAYNAGDLGTFLARMDPDVVFRPDPQWPEPGPFVGRDAFAEFLHDFQGAWETVDLEVDEVEERDALAIAKCRWTVSGVTSHAPVTVAFTLVVRFDADGQATDITALFDHAAALRWADRA